MNPVMRLCLDKQYAVDTSKRHCQIQKKATCRVRWLKLAIATGRHPGDHAVVLHFLPSHHSPFFSNEAAKPLTLVDLIASSGWSTAFRPASQAQFCDKAVETVARQDDGIVNSSIIRPLAQFRDQALRLEPLSAPGSGLRPTARFTRPAARLRYSQKMQIPTPAA